MTAILPDMDASRPAQADPKKIIRAIKDFAATNMFASPALINKIGRFGEEQGIKLPSLKRVISAGAPASPLALERFSRMLSPGIEIFTPYGATEALPVCNIGSSEILQKTGKLTDQGKGSCIGRPNPGITLEIIKITDAPIGSWSDDLLVPKGEIGEIVVKGPIVTRSYYNREPATALAKIDKTWHRMGDVGYKDNSGRVWFCGRKSHRVETDEGTLFTLPCEAVFNIHPKVFRTALVGVKRDGRMLPVLCVELEKNVPADESERIKEELIKLGAAYPHTSKISTILFHPSFPVDIRHNAKIFREKLNVWAERKAA
jgi:acyl-coenzyme A synthetase/AMP-(fatty) acid ligase